MSTPSEPIAKPDRKVPAPRTGFGRAMLVGALAFVLLFGGVGGWLAYASIAGAVVARAVVVVKAKPKSVQHLDGGIVREILVKSGDLVEKDQVLIRMDGTLLRANFVIYQNRWREATARKARLEAERDGGSEVPPPTPSELVARPADDPHWAAQQRLFEARRAAREGQVSQLREKIEQFNNQTSGVSGLTKSTHDQIALYDRELAGLRMLFEKGLTPQTRLLALERERTNILGQLSQQEAELARIQNAIRETSISILQIQREFQETVLSELRQVTLETSELEQQIYATGEQIKRVEIKAPVSGAVHELNVFTIGGVIAPGTTLMQIISQEEGIELEANVETQFIDQVSVGQSATVRFSAFNHRTTPELAGQVVRVSPNSVVDEKSGFAFYRVGIHLTADELRRLGDHVLVPGMPADVFITTGERTVMSYLFKPLSDHFQHAFRER
jgi:HlyD family secretion protein